MTTIKIKLRTKIWPATKRMKQAGIKGKASVRVFFPGCDKPLFELNNFLIRARKKDNGLFVAPPQEEYEDKDGNTKYFSLVRVAPEEDFDEEGGFREMFEGSVMKAFKRATEDDDDDDDRPRRRRNRDDDKPRRKRNRDYDDDDDDDDDDRRSRKQAKKTSDFDNDDDDDTEDEWI